jgi:hypothetical protein
LELPSSNLSKRTMYLARWCQARFEKKVCSSVIGFA